VRELRDLTSILTSSSGRHGPNRKAVAEDNEVGWNGCNPGAWQNHTDKIQRIAGGEFHFYRASRPVTLPDRTKCFDGFG